MGTISEKLEYLNDTKTLLKQKINNLGGDITSETTFRQYADKLQNVYDILPKTSYAEGSNITLSNTLKGKLDFENDIVGYGYTKQESTTGKNKLPTQKTMWESGQYNTEGNKSDYATRMRTVDLIPVNPSTEYYVESALGTLFIIREYGENKEFVYNKAGVYSGRSFTTQSNTYYLGVILDKSYSDYEENTDKVLMYLNSETDKTWEPYADGPAPNPNYPFPIEVVRGKNIFDKDNAITSGYLVASDGHIGTSSNHVISDYIEIQGGKQYTTSGFSNSGSLPSVCFYDSNKTFISGISHNNQNPITYTTPSNAKYLRESLLVADKNTLQIESGSQATSYLPYNTIEVVERGKNELKNTLTTQTKNGMTATVNDDGSIVFNGTTTAQTDFNLISEQINFENGDYTVSISDVGQAGVYIQWGVTGAGIWSYHDHTKNVTTSFPVTSGGNTYSYINMCRIRIANGVTCNNYKVYPQIEEGSATTYEPYQEPKTYQLSLEEYEFAKIGNYVDTIEYDVDEDKVYKNEKIGKVVLNGSENWNTATSVVSGTTRFFYNNNDVLNEGNASYNTKLVKSDKFKGIGWGDIYGSDTTTINAVANYNSNEGNVGRIVIRISNEFANTIANFKTWLSTHNTEVRYVKAQETKTEITGTLATQIKALYNSQSFTGTTILTSNGQLPLVLKVRALKGE